jgi:hypothetical protein
MPWPAAITVHPESALQRRDGVDQLIARYGD